MTFRLFFSALIACIILGSCSDSEPDAPTATGERTVLVYMVAANTLGQSVTTGGQRYERADEEDVAEMIAGTDALASGQRLLVYRDCYEGNPTLSEVTAAGLRQLKEYDRSATSLDRSRMTGVIADARSLAPADKFGLVLWSHANGWLQDGTTSQAQAAAPVKRSFGIDRGRRLNVTDLASYLEGQDLEFIYFDCCLMASVEVMYQMRACAPYIVGSTSELPRPGMPYDRCLPLLFAGPPDGLIASARATFDYYAAHTNPDYRTCSISVIRTAGLADLAAATAAIYRGAPLAHQGESVTNYDGYGRSGSWIDFGEYAASLTSDAALLGAFNNALAKTVIYQDATDYMWMRYPVYNSSGLSTYVFTSPGDYSYKGYDELDWARDVVDITSRTY